MCIRDSFIGELISGDHINKVAFEYGEKHEAALKIEFLNSINNEDYTDWLYGTSGKDDRPNDLGYWIGYKITHAYFEKAIDKKQAISDILSIDDAHSFMDESGYFKM